MTAIARSGFRQTWAVLMLGTSVISAACLPPSLKDAVFEEQLLGFFARHIIPVYSFGRITIEPSRLRLAMLDADWVESAEEAGLLTMGTKRAEPLADVLLTAKPAELQRFARAYSNDEAVFGERLEFVRSEAFDPTASVSSGQLAGRCYSEK